MSILVKDVVKLDSFKNIKLVGGRSGLDKTVNWIYVAECFENPLESLKWVYGGEIVFITGRAIKGDINLLSKLIEGFNEKNIAGLIINVGPYINHIPKKIIDLVNGLDLALFELPWEIRITEATKDIYTAIAMKRLQEDSSVNFFHELLFGEENLEGNLVDKAAYFGYNLSGEYRVYIVDIDNFHKYIKDNDMNNEIIISEVKTKLKKIIRDTLCNHSIKVPIIDKNDSVIFIYKLNKNKIKVLPEALDKIKKLVINQIGGMTVSIGVGDCYNDLNMIKNSLKEAQLALKKIKIEGLKDCILEYKNIGVYQMLFYLEDTRNLNKYYEHKLRPIIEYDNINNSKLIETLEVYLDENCNYTRTSERLFLHRNSLRYRINKIEELLDVDLRELNHCIDIKLALEAKKIISNKEN